MVTLYLAYCSEEMARKLATARTQRREFNELSHTAHTTKDVPETSAVEGSLEEEAEEEKKRELVLVVKADTQVALAIIQILILESPCSHSWCGR